MILDEATSALDPATEAGILATIDRISKQRTVIMITTVLLMPCVQIRCLCWKMAVLWYHVSHTDLIQQEGIYSTLWQQVNGGNTDAMGIVSI